MVDAGRELDGVTLPPLPAGPLRPELLAGWLALCRNDLEAPARTLAPPVAEALAQIARAPGILLARMSGSGATCFGLLRDMAAARAAARVVQIAHPRWWVVPTTILTAAPEPSRLLVQPRAAE